MTSKKQNFYHKAIKNYDSLSLESQKKLIQCINEAESKYSESEIDKENSVNKLLNDNFMSTSSISVIGLAIAGGMGVFFGKVAFIGTAVLDAIFTGYLFTSVIPSKSDLIKDFDAQLSDNYKNDVCGCVTKNPIDDMQIDYC